jgi:hypothetical protein
MEDGGRIGTWMLECSNLNICLFLNLEKNKSISHFYLGMVSGVKILTWPAKNGGNSCQGHPCNFLLSLAPTSLAFSLGVWGAEPSGGGRSPCFRTP